MMDVESNSTQMGYRIEAVIEWLNVSYAELLEHGYRGALKLGISAVHMPPLVIFRKVDGDDCEVSEDELQRTGLKQPESMSSMAATRIRRKLLIHPDDIPILDSPRLLPKKTHVEGGFYDSSEKFYPLRFLPWPPDKLPDGWYYMPPKHLQSDGPTRSLTLVEAMAGSQRDIRRPIPVGLNGLLIPSTEIEKIKSRNYAAKQAAADDVLNTKTEEKYQAMIAAMAQIIASKAPGYKNGESPNAAQIEGAILQTKLVDRKPGTVAKAISAAWDKFGK